MHACLSRPLNSDFNCNQHPDPHADSDPQPHADPDPDRDADTRASDNCFFGG